MLQALPITKDFSDITLVKDVYETSFLESERSPLPYLLRKAEKEFVNFLGFYDGDVFVGFVYAATKADLTFVFYLAVNPKAQSKGYGSKMLEHLERLYPANRMVLDIEAIDEAANNAQQRVKRKAFYLKNGYIPAGFHILEKGARYEVLVKKGSCTFSEYESILKLFSGRLRYFFTKPKIIV